MRGSHGSAIIFDLSRRESFDKVGSFIREIQESNNQDKPVILIGNKADLEGYRQISFEEAKQFADSIGASYAETSALTGFNVDDAFRLLISEAASKALLENP
ncbi:unnamed protein product [Blepharisma stoltei]|uniref:Uncharacterized protein n=1 Tax=Blepharisma stoltei TaxID=1481888 RepID=A0AAU9IGX9_9CILI|nr:unnamed protein product [Blepharisma stoltei]